MLIKKAVVVLTMIVSLVAVNAQSLPFKSISNVERQFKVLYNPSLLASEPENGFLLVFDGYQYDDSGFADNYKQNFTGAVSLGNIGFAYSNVAEKYGTYSLVTGHKISDGIYAGSTFRWFNYNDLDFEYDISTTYRPIKYLSLALKLDNIFERNNSFSQTTFAFGFRPFTNRATLTGDFKINDYSFEDDILYTVGVTSEVIDGLNIGLNYSDVISDASVNPDATIGIELSLNIGPGKGSLGSFTSSSDEFSNGNMGVYLSTSNLNGHSIYEKENSKILKLVLQGAYIEEKVPFSISSLITGASSNIITVTELIKRINKLAKDKTVAGIILEDKGYSLSFAGREEVRLALQNFKNKGKKIVTYFVNSSQSSYFLTSIADKIFMYPMGDLTLNGLGIEMTFFKNLLSKVGVEAQAIRHGKYKSAVEMFTKEKASPENIEQMDALLTTIDKMFMKEISASRGMSEEDLSKLINYTPYHSGKSALESNLVDGLLYHGQLDTTAINFINKDAKLVTDSKFFASPDRNYSWESANDEKIAIVYASGSIVMGGSSSGSGGLLGSDNMGSETTAKLIRAARNDNSVKAIILRIDSGGGSGLASDIILREIRLAQDENKKPVIVSMGGAAASGGYYIACFADKIIADKSTITGSIGVFGILPNADVLYDKLGITFDRVKKAKFSTFNPGGLLSSHKLNAQEEKIMQDNVDEFYEGFISLVAEGRKIDKSKIDEIAQGRVWSGEDALEIGLIDEVGGIEKAIEVAKDLAGLKDLDDEEMKFNIYSKGGSFSLNNMFTSVFYSFIPEEIRAGLSKVEVLTKFSSDERRRLMILPYEIEVR